MQNLTLLPTDATLFVAGSVSRIRQRHTCTFRFLLFLLPPPLHFVVDASRVILSRVATPFILVTCPSTKPRRALPMVAVFVPNELVGQASDIACSTVERYSDGAKHEPTISSRIGPCRRCPLVLHAFVEPRPLVGRLDVSLLLPRPPPPPLPDRWAP